MEYMLYINTIFVHFNSENKEWASELLWNSTQEDSDKRVQGKLRGDFSGTIQQDYFEGSLQSAVDAVLGLAKAFGISEHSPIGTPCIYYTEDDDLLERFPSNVDLEALIQEENKRRGWRD